MNEMHKDRLLRLSWFAEHALMLKDFCPGVNSHHFLELMGVYSGNKRVMRLALTAESCALVEDFCSETGLRLGHSKLKQAPVKADAQGDIFTISVAWDDPRGKYIIVLLSMDEQALEDALRLEDSGASAQEFGQLYGYPPCCVHAYSNLQHGEDWLHGYLRRSASAKKGYALGNCLAGMFDGSTLLPEYYPCQMHCEATLAVANTYLSLVMRVRLPAGIEQMMASLRAPILVRHGSLLQLPATRWQDGRLLHDISSIHSLSARDATEDTFFWQSDFLEVTDDCLRLFVGKRMVAEERICDYDNRLLLFD